MKYIFDRRYFIGSAAIHIGLLLLFSLYFEAGSDVRKVGISESRVVSAFIYQSNFQNSSELHDSPKLNTHSKNALTIKKSDKNKVNEKKAVQQETRASQGESVSTLIALLHDAIQKKQNYPASALEMQRQGKVTVAFELLQDGRVNNLRIINGSGTSSLDRAAIQAVMDAAPFNHLRQYLTKAQEYKIDIVFELA